MRYKETCRRILLTGETLTSVVMVALRERLERERRRLGGNNVAKDLMDIGRRYASLPDASAASPREIIGYDESGLPK